MFAETPEPPYIAVIFTSKHSGQDVEEYARVADRMIELASQQAGYLGVESARSENGLGITVSYWRDEECIQAWYHNAEHQDAQRNGREKWYEQFHLRVAHVNRAYSSWRARLAADLWSGLFKASRILNDLLNRWI